MPGQSRPGDQRRVVALELNALAAAGTLGEIDMSGLQISATPTKIYDVNGRILLHRYGLKRKDLSGWVDVAASHAFAKPVVAVSLGAPWAPAKLVAVATKKRPARTWNETRLVAYSFPKVAIQYLQNGKEVAMVEAFTNQPVPPAKGTTGEREPPGNFERWSVLDSVSAESAIGNKQALRERLAAWDDICPPGKWKRLGPKPFVIDPDRFIKIFPLRPRTRSRVLHYSTRNTDHSVCYEVRGQVTNVWCVAASVQMMLDFYRYEYTQDRLATALGLGTQANPNGLPYGQEANVVTQLEALTSNALAASMNTAPNWQEFVDEINANRPLISFVPGHSRTVAGFTETRIFNRFTDQGLLVYDPWPPTTGVITQWESFTSTTYRVTFTAHVTLV